MRQSLLILMSSGPIIKLATPVLIHYLPQYLAYQHLGPMSERLGNYDVFGDPPPQKKKTKAGSCKGHWGDTMMPFQAHGSKRDPVAAARPCL